MKLLQVSSVFAAIATTLLLSVVNAEEPVPEAQPDEPKPICPEQCGLDLNNLHQVAEKVIKKEATLVNDSCKKPENDAIDYSFKFQYTFEKTTPKPEGGDNRNLRQLQSIQPRPMPPIKGFNQTLFGFDIVPSRENEKEGYCMIAPNIRAGPFPNANLTSCIHDLQFVCYRIENEKCPCFDMDGVQAVKMRLMRRIYDPDFQVDMDLSCKNPKDNNGFPYGLYTKPNGITDKKYGSSLRIGVDINSGDSSPILNFMNKCYEKESFERNSGSKAEERVTIPQHKRCTSLMNELCTFVKSLYDEPNTSKPKLTPQLICEDDVNFRYRNNTWASCENMIGQSSRWRRRRACRKFDYDSNEYIFQKCSKSCKMCTCRDNSDFYMNGDPKYNCTWLNTLEASERKEICYSSNEVADNCKVACKSKCCKNNVDFSYWKELEDDSGYNGNNGYKKGRRNKESRKLNYVKQTCDDITSFNWMEECKTKKVALNCPMVCRKCPIKPRM